MNRIVIRISALALFTFVMVGLLEALVSPPPLADFGDERALHGHISQQDIEDGKLDLAALRRAGEELFTDKFTIFDGAGRPGATGNGDFTPREVGSAPRFTRLSGMDANSCFGCHAQPGPGGSGEFTTDVFTQAQNQDPIVTSILPDFSNERRTPDVFGAGAIEMLAREMTQELHQIRMRAIDQAHTHDGNVRVKLAAKGVNFGFLTAKPTGEVETSEVLGIDPDLIVKPWSQKGVVPSLRVFTVNAYNHHLGMQADERFGRARTGSDDCDQDGVFNELSVGDMTAATVFQAALPVPGRKFPKEAKHLVEQGERLFDRIGCAECHRPELILDSPVFVEPSPYNPPGTLNLSQVKKPFTFDLVKKCGLERLPDGRAVVRAYTDLKRHVISDEEKPFFANEKLPQNGVPPNQFITKRLWTVGSTRPYGHRGDLTTIIEAIENHGGEARKSRLAFEKLSDDDRKKVIGFLKSLQVVRN
jgi:hypothetical protein